MSVFFLRTKNTNNKTQKKTNTTKTITYICFLDSSLETIWVSRLESRIYMSVQTRVQKYIKFLDSSLEIYWISRLESRNPIHFQTRVQKRNQFLDSSLETDISFQTRVQNTFFLIIKKNQNLHLFSRLESRNVFQILDSSLETI